MYVEIEIEYYYLWSCFFGILLIIKQTKLLHYFLYCIGMRKYIQQRYIQTNNAFIRRSSLMKMIKKFWWILIMRRKRFKIRVLNSIVTLYTKYLVCTQKYNVREHKKQKKHSTLNSYMYRNGQARWKESSYLNTISMNKTLLYMIYHINRIIFMLLFVRLTKLFYLNFFECFFS